MPIRINEIVVSTTGIDTEFLELYGEPGTDLTGLSLLKIEPGGEIGTVIDLTGSIGVNGYYLLASPTAEARLGVTGNQSIADNTFTNGSRTYLLVENFTGTSGDDIDANDDGVIDNVLWDSIVDSVAPIDDDSPLIYSPNIVGPDGSFLSPGGYRDPAGTGAFVQHDFFDIASYTPTAGAPVVINEIVVSTTGVDTEFLELFGNAGDDLSSYSLLRIQSGGVIDTVIDLTGSVGENGYYLLASPEAEDELFVVADQQIADNTFTNGSRTYLLVDNFTGTSGDDIDANDDGVIDNVLWDSIADSVAPIDNDSPLVYSPNVVGPDGSFLAPGGYRDPEVSGAFVMHDFFDTASYTPQSGNDSRPLVINEIVVSTTGVDTEFLELLGDPSVDLSAYSILEIEPGGEIDTVIDLTGSTGENGYYLLASPAAEDELFVVADQQIADNTFTNGSRTYLLVKDFTGTSGDDIDTDDNGFIDNTLWSDITDSVAPIDNDSPLIYSSNVVGPDGSFLAPGGYRDPEGRGDFVMHDFFDTASYTPQSGNDSRPLVINEIVVSTTGVDTEFLELLGDPSVDLSAYSILEIEPGGEIDTVIDLTGSTGENGYYLLASPEAEDELFVVADQQIADNTFTNGSRTYLLVKDFTGTSGDDIDADDNGFIDNTLWSDITDSVAPIDNDSPLIYSSNVVGPDGSFLAPGGYRDPEGRGDFVMHDFFDTASYTPMSGNEQVPLVINEIVVSTTGVDTEFLELLGTPGDDLSTYSILEIEPDGEIDTVIDLTGTIGDNGYYLLTSPAAVSALGVIGNQTIADNTFTNGSRTYLLVENFTGASGDDIDADDNGFIDNALWSEITDSVAPIDNDSPLIYSSNVVGPDGSFLAPGGYRSPEGNGDFVMHDFSDLASYTPTVGTYTPTVAINEIVVSTTGIDAEFLELLGDPSTSLANMTILEILSGGEIDNVIGLSGQTGDNGYFLLASPTAEATFSLTANQAIPNNTFTNGSRTYLLVEDFSGAIGDDIDIDDNGVLDTPFWSSIVDGVAPIDNDSPQVYTNNVVGPDGSFLAPGGYRDPERSGDFVMHDFSDFAAYTPTEGTGDTSGEPGGDDPTLISTIQGNTDTSPLNGATVTVEAIVVGDFQNGDADALRNLGGFFVQEEAANQDGDAATSEGLFIYDVPLGLVDVSLGDRVQVTGTVSEFQGQTQLTASSITVVEAGAVADVNTLAVSVSLDAIDATVVDAEGNYAPDMEAYEGMLATFTDTLTVNELFQLDRFNEIRLSANGRPDQFTQLFDPDPAAFDAYQQQTGSDQIIFDDGLNLQNAAILPEADLDGNGVFNTADGFTMGDTITGLTGIVNYTWAGNTASDTSWRVRSVDDGNTFVDSNVRDVTPPDVGGTLTVATFNVLNFFTTLDVAGNPGSGPFNLDPRGADNIDEFNRQVDKLVTTLSAMDADVFGLVELENEFQTDQNGDGLVAINFLVDALNASLGSPTYAVVDPGRAYVDVSDAISVGLIYNTETVDLVAGSVEILDDSDLAGLSGTYTTPLFDGPSTNRAPLAATFVDANTGEDFTVAVTHMKSKGGSGTGDDADAGDGAGAFDATRTQGVEALTEWLDTFADEDVLVLGDFNAYLQEDPIDAMLTSGYTNLGETFSPGQDSYVFDGKTGTLDYAFANTSLSAYVTDAASWQINSDEPDAIDYNTDFGRDASIFDGAVPNRSSDHDPIIVGLEFPGEPALNPIVGTEASDYLVGTDEADAIQSLGGSYDKMAGGLGEDVFVFGAETLNGRRERDVILDYEVGMDAIVLTDGASVGSIRQTSTQVVVFLEGDRDAIYVRGDGVTDDNLSIFTDAEFVFG